MLLCWPGQVPAAGSRIGKSRTSDEAGENARKRVAKFVLRGRFSAALELAASRHAAHLRQRTTSAGSIVACESVEECKNSESGMKPCGQKLYSRGRGITLGNLVTELPVPAPVFVLSLGSPFCCHLLLPSLVLATRCAGVRCGSARAPLLMHGKRTPSTRFKEQGHYRGAQPAHRPS